MAAFVNPRTLRLGRSVVGVAVLAALAVLVVSALALLGAIPSLNPFSSETVDRSQPAVLHALADVTQYRAAVGTYSVVVDVERDARFLPSFVRGERAVLTSTGTVDATVDLGGLDRSTVVVSKDQSSVTVTLPTAVLGEPHLDLAETHVVSRDRGLLDRVGGIFADSPTSERALQRLAERRMAAAASADDALVRRAEAGTRRLVTSLLAPLDFERIVVRFTPPPS